MGQKRKATSPYRGMQVVTLCISTTMVLILIGLVALSVQTTRNLSDYVREHLTVTVMLGDSIPAAEGTQLCTRLRNMPYAKDVTYISKEQALREQTEAMGTDPSEFLGMNPFVASIEMHVMADYANGDSLRMIADQLEANCPQVAEVSYQEDLTDRVNTNLQRVSLVFLCLAVLLIFVSYSLISNSVRLSIYARRFDIHTMKLVGASWGFIRKPFLQQACGVGFVAALLACFVLALVVAALYRYQPGIEEVIDWQELLVTGIAVLLFGLLITLFCSWIAVNKFLRMTAGELYKI